MALDEIPTEFPKIQRIREDGEFIERIPYITPQIEGEDNQYLRTGGCTVGCGGCCQDIFLKIDMDEGLAANNEMLVDYARWLKMHGVTLVKRPHGWFVVIGNKCENLAEDGSCKIHGTAEYPLVCRAFPMHPSQIDGIEHICTYKFMPIEPV